MQPITSTNLLLGYECRSSYPNGPAYDRPSLVYLRKMLQEHWQLQFMRADPKGFIVMLYEDVLGASEQWSIADNGGELNLQRLNDPAYLRSIPYEQETGLVPIGRVAWFCMKVIKDEEIPSFGPNPEVDDLTIQTPRPLCPSCNDDTFNDGSVCLTCGHNVVSDPEPEPAPPGYTIKLFPSELWGWQFKQGDVITAISPNLFSDREGALGATWSIYWAHNLARGLSVSQAKAAVLRLHDGE